jgi:CRP-like cAMP-binding protein
LAGQRRSAESAGETTQVRNACEHCFEEGEMIFEQSDEGTDLYVIRSGHVEMSRSGPAGSRVVGKLGPGEFFGEISAVLGACGRGGADGVA